jgi:hypothetical protein
VFECDFNHIDHQLIYTDDVDGSSLFSHVNSCEHIVGDISGREQSNDLVEGVELAHEFSNVSFVVGNIGVPSGGLFIKISLGKISISGGSISEFFLVSDVSVDKVELGVVGEKSGLSLLNSVVTDGEEVVESLNLLSVNSVGISLGVQEVLEEVVKKVEDLLGGAGISKLLGHLDESLGEMSDRGVGFKMALELLDVGLGFLDLSKRSTVEETFDELDALLGRCPKSLLTPAPPNRSSTFLTTSSKTS